MQALDKIIEVLAELITIATGGIALYLFIFRGKEIVSFFRLLQRYAFQMTQMELASKLDRLNELNADDAKGKEESINIFGAIQGQIAGNRLLKPQSAGILGKIADYMATPARLTEPYKRSLVSEIRETIRHLDIRDYSAITGGKG